jgi:septal ring factor EnvC (AmiA/AmiB activator)
LVECPSCGTEVANAVKSWPVSFGKHDESDAHSQLCIGIFECPKCKSKFRSRVEPTAESAETASVSDLVERIKGIREGFTQTLTTLRDRIRMLETERSGVLGEMDELKRAAESRADALEAEVQQLREEVKSLRELFGAQR